MSLSAPYRGDKEIGEKWKVGERECRGQIGQISVKDKWGIELKILRSTHLKSHRFILGLPL